MEIRIWLPDTVAGWRYCLKHPASFIIGTYGFKQFVEQRTIMMDAISRANDIDIKYRQTVAKLADARKEISDLKRNKDKKQLDKDSTNV